MKFRTILKLDKSTRSYGGVLDFWSYPYRIEVRQELRDGETVLILSAEPEAKVATCEKK